MTADARTERLIASILADRSVLVTLQQRLVSALARQPWATGEPILYLVGVTLDHYYSAFESLAERVCRSFEGVPDRGERWHKELLDGTALDIAGVRPAVIRRTTLAVLHGLLEFRHFMRHAYAVDLDPTLLHDLAQRLLQLHPELLADVDLFVAALRG